MDNNWRKITVTYKLREDGKWYWGTGNLMNEDQSGLMVSELISLKEVEMMQLEGLIVMNISAKLFEIGAQMYDNLDFLVITGNIGSFAFLDNRFDQRDFDVWFFGHVGSVHTRGTFVSNLRVPHSTGVKHISALNGTRIIDFKNIAESGASIELRSIERDVWV